jgi:hypothetical protein
MQCVSWRRRCACRRVPPSGHAADAARGGVGWLSRQPPGYVPARTLRLPAVGDLRNGVPLPQTAAVDLAIAPAGVEGPELVLRPAPAVRHSVEAAGAVRCRCGGRRSPRDAWSPAVPDHPGSPILPPLGLHVRGIDVQPFRRP